MKKTFTTLSLLLALGLSSTSANAQGWPKDYGGVMLQGFYWDSFADSQWSYLEEQADDISKYFSLVWIPQSGNCNSSYNQMGYMPVYYFDHNSSFGTEAQLRSMIKAYSDRGTGIIADVVINHRNNLGVDGSWVDYPAETYKGETYQMLSTDIVKNDDGNKTLDWGFRKTTIRARAGTAAATSTTRARTSTRSSRPISTISSTTSATQASATIW